MSTAKSNEKKSRGGSATGGGAAGGAGAARMSADRRPRSRDDKKVYYRDGCRLDVEPLKLNPENNWITFSDTMIVLAEKEYGALADLLKGKKFPKKPMPSFDEKLFAHDPLGLKKLEAQEQVKEIVHYNQKLQDDKRKMYAWIWLHLSDESRLRVSETPNFKDGIEATRTPRRPGSPRPSAKSAHCSHGQMCVRNPVNH